MPNLIVDLFVGGKAVYVSRKRLLAIAEELFGLALESAHLLAGACGVFVMAGVGR